MSPSRVSLVFSLALLSLLHAGSSRAQAWKPYAFQGSEHFQYAISSIEGGEQKSGSLTLDIAKEGMEKYKVSFSSKLGDSESSSSTTATADELAGKVLMAMVMSGSEAGTIIGATLFSQALPMMFMGVTDLEVGSGWSRTEGEKEASFQVEGKETVAGQEGYRCVFKEGGVVKYQQVISPDIPLPLRTEMVDDQGNRYVSQLLDFKR